MRLASTEEREDLLRSEQNALIMDRMLLNGALDHETIVEGMPGILHLNAKDDLTKPGKVQNVRLRTKNIT